ncbi:hypothetical protein WOLCODRAFT_71967, partial [Wolfiporia cocos MD-104 SS10]
GYNLRALQKGVVPAHDQWLVDTSLCVEVLTGTYGRVAARSGNAIKHKIDIAAGIIDPGYQG